MDDSSGRVLVVSAAHDSRASWQFALEQVGFAVEVATDGAHCLRLLQQPGLFDLLLLDLAAVGDDGMQLLRAVGEQFSALAIIVLTEQNEFETTAWPMLLDAHTHLRKPRTADQFAAVVATVLRQRRSEQAEAQFAALHPLVLISERLNRQLDLPRLYEQIVATACELLHARQVVLVRRAADTRLTAVAGAAGSLANPQIWQPIANWIDVHQEMIVLGTGRKTPQGLDLPASAAQSVLIGAPLLAQDRLLGVLLVDIDRNGLLPPIAHAEMLAVLTRLAAIALENAELHTSVVRSEARYRALLEHARDAVLLIDRDATAVLEANAAVLTLSGYARDELLALAPAALIATIDEFARPGRLATEFETKLRTRDGQDVQVSVGVSDVIHDGVHYCLLILRDIGERQRLVQQVVQAEKLSGMGRVSASIAHEVNNPLQGLQSSLSLLVERSMSEEKRTQLLHMAQKQVGQLIGVVQHMMDLHRPINEGMRPVSLHELIEAVLALLAARLHEHSIVVDRDLESALPRVRAVSSQLKQVLTNLVLNAIEAMPGGGTLTVRTHAVGLAPVREVVVDVVDTGRGIAADKLKNIFEPFYSTSTERTGLSLAVSYTIIEQHRGTISVQSSDQGTTFSVALPALEL